MMEDAMSSSALPGELEELGERLKIEFGIDREILSPAIEERLQQLEAAERSDENWSERS